MMHIKLSNMKKQLNTIVKQQNQYKLITYITIIEQLHFQQANNLKTHLMMHYRVSNWRKTSKRDIKDLVKLNIG